MNTRKYLLFALPLIQALVMVPTMQGSARTVKTTFTGTDTLGRDIDPGTETYPDKNLYHVRNNVFTSLVEASDPRVSGEALYNFNGNFKLVDPPVYVTGRMWGTFKLSNADGYWEGIIEGVRIDNGFSYFKYVGQGEGAYKGMQLHMRYERLDPDPSVPATLYGYILENE
jgi:hypothetical protein